MYGNWAFSPVPTPTMGESVVRLFARVVEADFPSCASVKAMGSRAAAKGDAKIIRAEAIYLLI